MTWDKCCLNPPRLLWQHAAPCVRRNAGIVPPGCAHGSATCCVMVATSKLCAFNAVAAYDHVDSVCYGMIISEFRSFHKRKVCCTRGAVATTYTPRAGSAGASTSTTTRLQQGNNLAVVKASSSVSHLVGSYQRPVRAHTLACASQVTLPRQGNCGSPGPTAGHRRIAGRGHHPVRCAITSAKTNAACHLAAQTARQPPRFAIQLYSPVASSTGWHHPRGVALSRRADRRPCQEPSACCTTRRCPAA